MADPAVPPVQQHEIAGVAADVPGMEVPVDQRVGQAAVANFDEPRRQAGNEGHEHGAIVCGDLGGVSIHDRSNRLRQGRRPPVGRANFQQLIDAGRPRPL